MSVKEPWTDEDEIYNIEDAKFRKPYRNDPNDRMNLWLDSNTALGGKPPTFEELDFEIRLARDEQYSKLEREKRYLYRAYHAFYEGINVRWQYIGVFEFDRKDDVYPKQQELEKKHHPNEVKLEFYRSRW